MSAARGVRNNNPGNIDFSEANKWQGQTGKEPEGRFARFSSPQFGIRALALLLITYQDRHNLRTVREILNRWAPPVENNTSGYVGRVCYLTGFAPNDILNMHSYAHVAPLVKAIISVECAGYKYPDSVVDEGLRMAGIVAGAATVAARSSTTAAATGVAAAGVGATAAVQVVEAVGPHLGMAAGLAQAVGPWVVGVALVVVAGLFVWHRYQKQKALQGLNI